MTRVVLVPGNVRSESDGQWHFIPAHKLAELSGVPLARCIVWDHRTDAGKRFRPAPTDITIYPQASGDYETRGAQARAALGLEG